MTTKQLQQAIEMHKSGITWLIIASYFNTTTDKLRRRLKRYEQTNSEIH